MTQLDTIMDGYSAELRDDYDRNPAGRFMEEPGEPGNYSYQNAATCPDCGAGMIRLGGCFSCPLCGSGACGG